MSKHPLFAHPHLARLALSLLFALALTLLGNPTPAHAATINVDGTTCTLADAITSANSDMATGGCTTGSGPDTLNLTADIDLTAVLPDITSEITIAGNGHTIARTGGPDFRIFTVSSSGHLTLNEATVTGGVSIPFGGGIYNDSGTVTLTNSTLSGNLGSNTGGGIYNNSGTVTLTNSTLSGNLAGRGGAFTAMAR